MSADSSPLFQPLDLGGLELPNRIVMGPLTRSRADHATDAPHALNVDYYVQRASAGLIVTEATQISQQGKGYAWTPGIYTEAQVEGWRKVTDAVHAAGGRMCLQLWHVGRISHTSFQPGGGKPVAPSAIRAEAQTFLGQGMAPVSAPRALETEEIPLIIRDFLNAAENAKRAGFDAVEVHAANGYLLNQFLCDKTNHRSDAYGGSIENRTRIVVEAVEAVMRVFDPTRVGIRLSPVSPAGDIADSDPQALYDYLVREMSALRIGYIHVIEGSTGGPRDHAPFDFQALRRLFKGVYMANNGYTRDLAIEAVAAGRADLVAFGRPFIANPDLVARLRVDAPLAQDDKATWYGGDARGYTDYPVLERVA